VTSPTRRWDLFVAALLFLATAAFVLWQNAHIAVLWDLSYLLDTSWRIALGQMPYRDFPLVHPPVTFLIQAAIMRLAGRYYWLQIAYAALAGGLGTVLAWRIVLRILKGIRHAWAISLMLAAPLVVLGIYSVYPHPIYDGDCALAVLAAVWMVQRLSSRGPTTSSTFRSRLAVLVAGAAVVLPVFIKQNIGLPFLFVVVFSLALLLVLHWTGRAPEPSAAPVWMRLLAAIGSMLMLGLLGIQLTAGLGNYLHWTVQFAAQRRLPGLATVFGAYRDSSLLWTLPCAACGLLLLLLPAARRVWIQALAYILIAAPFAATLLFLFNNDDRGDRADSLLSLWPLLLLTTAAVAVLELRKGVTLARLMPFAILAAIQGTFLSQSLEGSTYAIWPLLILLVAGALAAIPPAAQKLAPYLAATVSVTFLFCGGLYSVSRDRMDYVDTPEGPAVHATLPALIGMATPGPYLPEFEELVRYANRQIPTQDALLIFPGEDPFYFATGRMPQFPVLLFDPTTDPYSPKALLAEAGNQGVRWVIVKTHRQSIEDVMPDKAETLALMQRQFHLYKKLAAYDIYRR
jgi:hypothetical protein